MFGDILRSTLAVPVFGTLHQNSTLSTARIIHTNHMVHYTHKSHGAYTNARKTCSCEPRGKAAHAIVFSSVNVHLYGDAEFWCMSLKTNNSTIRLIKIKSAS